MRKFAIAIAFILSASLASAQEAGADKGAVASAAQSSAYKAGAWLGSALQSPISVGKSFFSGLVAKTSPAATATDSRTPLKSREDIVSEFPDSNTPFSSGSAVKAEASPAFVSPLEAIRNQVSSLLASQQRKASEGLAPVEDRSVYVSER